MKKPTKDPNAMHVQGHEGAKWTDPTGRSWTFCDGEWVTMTPEEAWYQTLVHAGLPPDLDPFDAFNAVTSLGERITKRLNETKEALQSALDKATADNNGYPVCAWCRNTPCEAHCPTHAWKELLDD